MPTAPVHTFANLRVDPVIDPESTSEIAVNLAASTTYPAGTILGELVGTDEEVTVTLGAGNTGGTLTLTFGAQTTSALAYNATAAQWQTALEALSTIGYGNVRVTKDSALVYRLVFRGALGSTNVGAVTTTPSMTGGTNTATVAVATSGVAGTPGVYAAYLAGNTNGSQIPKGILRYACVTDSAGLISYGLSGSSEHGQTSKSAPMFIRGTFRTDDLVGLDTAGLALMGRLAYGTLAHGAAVIFGG